MRKVVCEKGLVKNRTVVDNLPNELHCPERSGGLK
jgi:hypothetical protein